MHLLFTGGSGYIGSNTALEFLKNTSCQISILDNLSTGFIENFEYLQNQFNNRVHLIKADLSDIKTLEDLFINHHFDCVLHFGASLIVSESVSNPLLYYSNNTVNTTQLITMCLKYKIKKFIFSSTAAVYGEPDARLIPVNESAPLAPINPYGASKMMSERILEDTSKAYDFNYVALRYFNVAGSNIQDKSSLGVLGQRSKNATHLIKVACEYALGKRKNISIFGDDYPTKDGTCIRDYIHITDLANAHLQAYTYLQKYKKSEVFNVGYSQGYSVKEVIEMVKKISGIDFRVEISARRAGDPAVLISDNKKIMSLTDWIPRYNDLATIIKSAYEWEKKL
ncbi:UDP-glucose 4-epimerase GalE [Helicobacter cappadocius]|uniref:UDP-glucose 4-epimerase n=1 Tax=Helicobacter cappadocius TaxID=3063998 RepID=A0AA90PHG2_9HELI|nr:MULTISPECIES: UDP-glucose 4-epimerase GalE [unclassified Helicobacter]MDO7252485.1 UDP-glucose 4-epimerase GalE [Helicobacter sp. faydin-H75]MDP2538352.1 UDP-glucose 4-epimerase GalE [Helicobacter sp. faydin-H76]